MTKTTADLRTMTIAELRTEAVEMNARLIADTNDAIADFALRRIESEICRRQRLCRAEDPDPASYAVCALLAGHVGGHLSLTHNDRW